MNIKETINIDREVFQDNYKKVEIALLIPNMIYKER
jgi:hypothetical protein